MRKPLPTYYDGRMTAKKHPNRPTGLATTDYKNFEKWTYKQWAWQFLRRNPKFHEACDAAIDDSGRQAVAAEFYLKQFKHYLDAYHGDYGRPLFVNSSLDRWGCPTGTPLVEKKLKIADGQVLIRFDLSTTTLDDEAIEAQIRTAAAILYARRANYLRARGVAWPAKQSARPSYLLRSLRLLDLIENMHMPFGKALSIVNAHGKTRMLPAEALAAHGHQIKAAVELMNEGYKHLANLSGKPSPEKFVSAN